MCCVCVAVSVESLRCCAGSDLGAVFNGLVVVLAAPPAL